MKTSSVPWYGSVGTITVVRLTELVQSSHVRFCTAATATAAKSLQSCLTLCDRRDGSPLGFPFPGILQARTLEWGAIAFSKILYYNILNEDYWIDLESDRNMGREKGKKIHKLFDTHCARGGFLKIHTDILGG